MQVLALARAQSLASQSFAAATAKPGAGTLHIETGTWDSGQTAFTPGAAPGVDIAVAATDTLADVRDKINAAGAGVTATILTDAGGARLLLRSGTTGLGNAFRTSVTDADGNNADALGLSAFAFDPSTGAAVMSQTETAADASATFNGLAISSASNTLANLVDGVTLTLAGVTPAPVAISITQDSAGMKKSVQAFVDAYNALAKLIGGQVKYDAANKVAGPLQGDSAAVGIQRQMRSLVGAASGASSAFSRLSDIGLQMQQDGSLSVDGTKLDAAFAKLPELKKLLANSDPLVSANNGIARQFRMMGDALLGATGAITTRTDGLNQRIETNQDQQDRLQTRLAQTQQRLLAQYTALDARLGQMNALSTYVTQQMTMLMNSSKKD
ncbi:MAG TPA: flagellar filament capping protein FliD [Burkholderiaceae bacterium]|nr:flagellar filament capping protein FliD [Burkholderiaceae bacterium]